VCAASEVRICACRFAFWRCRLAACVFRAATANTQHHCDLSLSEALKGPLQGPLLCVAGEASGDSAVARVIGQLPDASAFGLGGSAMQARGALLCANLEDTTAMGLADVAPRLSRLYRIRREILHLARLRGARVALLFNYSEFNVSLLRPLRKLGIRTLFYSPPQVWAWRPERARAIATHTSAIATILPFEAPLWQAMGADATYVGHPALEYASAPRRPRNTPSASDTAQIPRIAILPGSRPEEVRRMLPCMLAAFKYIEHCRANAHVVIAASLDADTRNSIRASAARAGIACLDVSAEHGLAEIFHRFDYSLCASGTATVESVLAGVPPVVAYKVSMLVGFLARMYLQTPYVSLPNVILARQAFPELLQHRLTAERLGQLLAETMQGHRQEKQQADCRAVAAYLEGARARQWGTPSAHVAHLLSQLA
jgi:lipid-A-disaccharide synthase